jgi:hypothetical protein
VTEAYWLDQEEGGALREHATEVAPPDRVHSAVIARWLLESAQLAHGPEQGGVVGSFASDAEPAYVYAEATGYYLSWLAFAYASGELSRERATPRASAAASWMKGRFVAAGMPTRVLLRPDHYDWRNRLTFAFDLGMVARGLDAARVLFRSNVVDPIIDAVLHRLEQLSTRDELLRSHDILPGAEEPMPYRWSTRLDVHHLKTCAGILAMPRSRTPARLRATAARTYALLKATILEQEIEDLHPFLYGVEGLLVAGARRQDVDALVVAEAALARVFELQRADGTLPESAGGAPSPRGDVLAQALRAAACLRGLGAAAEHRFREPIEGLGAALDRHIRHGGSVSFRAPPDGANTWAAMFAHQARSFHERLIAGRGVHRELVGMIV